MLHSVTTYSLLSVAFATRWNPKHPSYVSTRLFCKSLLVIFFLFRFETTSIYPLDSNKYLASRFDPQLMEEYNAWKAAGGTELNWDILNEDDIDFTTPVNATQPLQSEVTNSSKETSNISLHVTASALLPTTPPPSMRQENQMSFTDNANDEYMLKSFLENFHTKVLVVPNGFQLDGN